MNHKVTITFNDLKESFDLPATDKGTRADKILAVAIFAVRNELMGPIGETEKQAYDRLMKAGLVCRFAPTGSKEQKTPVHYVVKAAGDDMTVLDKTLRTYEDARRAAVKLGGIVTNYSFANSRCWSQ